MKQNVIVFLLTIVNFLGIFVCIFVPFVLDPLEAIPVMATIFLVVMLSNWVIGKDI
jgi:hypothetical protein